MIENSCSLIVLGIPNKIEFGIDFYSYTVTDKFMGFKEIPSGIHFIHFSLDSEPKTCFFEDFKKGETKVIQWDSKEEDFFVPSDEIKKETIFKYNNKDFSQNVGPYPIDKYSIWRSLSHFITIQVVSKIEPINKKIYQEKKNLFFTTIPQKLKSSDPQSTTKNNFDKSEILNQTIKNEFKSGFFLF